MTHIHVVATIVFVSRVETRKIKLFKGRMRGTVHKKRSMNHMPIAIDFVSSRRKKIAVDVVPAEWQLYIAH